MKTMINLLMNGQLTATLQEIFNRATGSTNKLSFQPVPSYWELNPAERLAGMVRK